MNAAKNIEDLVAKKKDGINTNIGFRDVSPRVTFSISLVKTSVSAYNVIVFVPTLAAVMAAKVAENATDYSLNNTVRNMLFLPCTYEEKFSAKQAIDSFFVRMGDVLSALARLLETCQRRRRRALGQNAIVGAEPSLERRGQRRQRLRIVVDQEQDRIRHDRPDWPRGRGPSSGTHDLATRRSRRRGDARARCRDA